MKLFCVKRNGYTSIKEKEESETLMNLAEYEDDGILQNKIKRRKKHRNEKQQKNSNELHDINLNSVLVISKNHLIDFNEMKANNRESKPTLLELASEYELQMNERICYQSPRILRISSISYGKYDTEACN